MAKQVVEHRAQDSLQALGLPNNKIFITPMPFNTVLWRIVVLDGESYREGMASLLDNNREVSFTRLHRGSWPMNDTPEALSSFLVFSNGFVSYQVEDDRLIVSDLRMGLPDNFAFQFRFAEKDVNNQWQAHTPERVRSEISINNMDRLVDRLLGKREVETSEACSLC